jgi:hypothetical protein
MSNLANLRETLERLDSALEDYILNGEVDTTAERSYCRQALQLLEAVEKEQAPNLIMQMMPDGTVQPLLPPEYYEWLGFRAAAQRSEGEQ